MIVEHAEKSCQAYQIIQSTYRWYVSGNPFPSGVKSIMQALKCIGFELDEKPGRLTLAQLSENPLNIKHQPFLVAVLLALKQCLFYRNTQPVIQPLPESNHAFYGGHPTEG